MLRLCFPPPPTGGSRCPLRRLPLFLSCPAANSFLTDNSDLRFFGSFRGVRTTNGFWQRHAYNTVIGAEHNMIVGVKKTMKFHTYTGTEDQLGHERLPCIHGTWKFICPRHHHDQAFRAPSGETSFNSIQRGYRPMHYYPKRPSDIILKSYIAEFENILLGDPDDPDNSTDTGNSGARRGVPPAPDHGQSKKRKKISDVWDYFTKIFARDINGKVLTFAACNHCCKILSGSSKNGTSQLARHACPCKFKPVAAGRNAKDSGGDVSVLWS